MPYNIWMKSRRAKGFTLVEVVTVIIVVVILCAIVMGRYAGTNGAAHNAVIQNFLKDCKTVQAKMTYGDSSSGFQRMNFMSLGSALSIPGFESATAELDPDSNKLTIRGIPANFFKNGMTELDIDFDAQTYHGKDLSSFLNDVKW
jgi:prepilin-type N-terminal cleavage/methylation domain-containing protein